MAQFTAAFGFIGHSTDGTLATVHTLSRIAIRTDNGAIVDFEDRKIRKGIDTANVVFVTNTALTGALDTARVRHGGTVVLRKANGEITDAGIAVLAQFGGRKGTYSLAQYAAKFDFDAAKTVAFYARPRAQQSIDDNAAALTDLAVALGIAG